MAGWKQRQLLAEGTLAPEFELRGLDGNPHSLASILARGPALLAFFKVSCPVCQYTLPFLERIYQGSGREAGAVQILAVSQDKAGSTREFNEEFGITFPALLDDGNGGYPVSNAFGIASVPSLFLIEPDGTISLSGTGFSKKDLEVVGHRAGVAPFRQGERVPEQRPG
jgi:peroxiredoxin